MHNLLPGVPSVESPFFAQLFTPETTDAETLRIARDLHQHGFAVFDFPDPDFDAVAETIREALAPAFDLAGWRAQSGPNSPRLEGGWRRHEGVRRLAVNAEVLAQLGRLYGREAFPFQTLNFPVGSQQAFHSDSLHFSSMPERFMCGVWVALEDVGPEQGPLIYYPGSHRWPIYGGAEIGHTAALSPGTTQAVYEPLWRALVEAHGVQPERFHARKGQALIWAANLLHGGDRHIDRNLTRWSQVTHYYFRDCAYYTPMLSDVSAGSIAYRLPTDIRSGEIVDGVYNGRVLPESYVAFTDPVNAAPRLERGNPPFDGEAYLAANPDLRAAGVDPLQHWKRHGRAEGRSRGF